MVPCIGLWCVVVVFPDPAHLLFKAHFLFVEYFCLTFQPSVLTMKTVSGKLF